MFLAFKAQKWQHQRLLDMAAIQPILDHMKTIWCNDDDASYQYLLNVLAHRFQRKQRKLGIAIVLMGAQGSGKGMLVTWIGEQIIGNHLFAYVNDIDSVTGKFNSRLAYKALTFCDECSNYGGAHRSNNKLKSLITETTIPVEPKGIDSFTVDDNNAYIIASNEERPVKVEQNDRRYFCLETSSDQVGNKAYFDSLEKAMNTPGVADAFYNYLLRRDLSTWNPVPIPDTESRRRLQGFEIPPAVLFLVHLHEHNGLPVDYCFVASELYTDWKAQQHSENITQDSFIKSLTTLLKVARKKKRIAGHSNPVSCLDFESKQNFEHKLQPFMPE
jgi:hypothetical protein